MSRSGGAASLRYDPLGRLYEVAGPWGTTRFLYDGEDLVAEYDTSGTLLRRYVHGDGAGDDPLVWFEGSGVADAARRYLYADERGSIVAISDANGNKLAINAYDEYGIPGATNQGRFQYTGQIWLPEMGLYYYKARMYSPTLGRFMQTDPIGYGDGMNMYRYVGIDPVNAVDPSGASEIIVEAPRIPKVYIESWSILPPLVDIFAIDNGGGGGEIVVTAPRLKKFKPKSNPIAPQKTQQPTPCQLAFLKSQLGSRGLPTSQLDNLKFVSGLDSNANAFSRQAFNGGATAVTQGSTVYVQPGSFNTVANFRSATGFEEAYHTAQFASDSRFYSTYGILSIGGLLSMGDSYNGNLYEAFAKGAAKQMFAASQSGMCQ